MQEKIKPVLNGTAETMLQSFDENKDILHYQFTATRYGKDLMKFNIEWLQKLLDEMKGSKI